jgi:uncharacterized membrane protein YbhN (UPF0104 family)
LFGFLGGGLLGLGMCAVASSVGHRVLPVLWAVMAGITAGPSFVFLLPLGEVQGDGRVRRILRTAHQGWEAIRASKLLLVQIVLLYGMSLSLIGGMYYIVLPDLGHPLSLPAVLIMSVTTNVLRIATVLPGNLGLREAIAGAVGASFGIPFSAGLLASSVGRVITLVWIFLFGTLGSAHLLRRTEPTEAPST